MGHIPGLGVVSAVLELGMRFEPSLRMRLAILTNQLGVAMAAE